MIKQEPIDYRHLLDNPGMYKILRRVTARAVSDRNLAQLEGFDKDAADIKRFAVLDFETTGFDPDSCQPIELGIITLDYSPSQNALRLVDTLSMMEQPDHPIPDIVTEITGLTDEKVEGHRFDEAQLATVIESCDYLLAHNASFDRAFWDRRFPQYADLSWGCTIKDIPWSEHGFESNKLEYLLFKHGYFYEGHHALTDCFAVVQLFLDTPHLLGHLERCIQSPMATLKATGLPYDHKDAVKERGYRWSGAERVWSITCTQEQLEAELDFLDTLKGYSGNKCTVIKIDQTDRYKEKQK